MIRFATNATMVNILRNMNRELGTAEIVGHGESSPFYIGTLDENI